MTHTKEFKHHISYIVMMSIIGLALTPIMIGFVVLLFIPGIRNTKITLGEKGLHIKSGWIMPTEKDIPYNKINNVEASTSLGANFGPIKIYVGHDKPITYNSIANVRDLKDAIMSHIS